MYSDVVKVKNHSVVVFWGFFIKWWHVTGQNKVHMSKYYKDRVGNISQPIKKYGICIASSWFQNSMFDI